MTLPSNSKIISPMANQSIFSKTNVSFKHDDLLLNNKVLLKTADKRDAFKEIV